MNSSEFSWIFMIFVFYCWYLVTFDPSLLIRDE